VIHQPVFLVSQYSLMPSWWLACGDQSQCIGIGSALEALRDDALYKYTFTFLYFTSGTLLVVVAVTSFVSCARYMQYVLYTDCTKSRDITIEHLKFDLTQLLFSFFVTLSCARAHHKHRQRVCLSIRPSHAYWYSVTTYDVRIMCTSPSGSPDQLSSSYLFRNKLSKQQ